MARDNNPSASWTHRRLSAQERALLKQYNDACGLNADIKPSTQQEIPDAICTPSPKQIQELNQITPRTKKPTFTKK